ncbi:hypothetical protein [Echinicola pacifica]|nr:hypothetical protein [Echinicola pacifica]
MEKIKWIPKLLMLISIMNLSTGMFLSFEAKACGGMLYACGADEAIEMIDQFHENCNEGSNMEIEDVCENDHYWTGK